VYNILFIFECQKITRWGSVGLNWFDCSGSKAEFEASFRFPTTFSRRFRKGIIYKSTI